jgi:signal transduction histidine kinase
VTSRSGLTAATWRHSLAAVDSTPAAAGATGGPSASGTRAAAVAGVKQRHDRERAVLYPIRVVLVVVVVLSVVLGHPSAWVDGRTAGVIVALVAFVAGVLFEPMRADRPGALAVLAIELLVAGAAGITLAALQSQAASELPASAVVFMAASRLPPRVAAVVGVPVTIGLGVVIGRAADAQTLAASVFLCIVLGAVGALARQARHNQDRTELLLAELEEARDEQARAAALAERSSIARELHDVLAQSLSGLSIQLEGARKLASSEGVSADLRAVIDSSATLAKQGLVEARSAVGVLREEVPTIERLPQLVGQARRDFRLPVELSVQGEPRTLPPEMSLALYRAAGEALTNVSRHAPGANTRVLLAWEREEVRLRVADGGGVPAAGSVPAEGTPAATGSGWGLVGMRERVARFGGTLHAGPEGGGWTVEIVLPA